MSDEDNNIKEVERKIVNPWKKYWGLKEIIKDKDLHILTKSLPVLTYRSEIWALTINIIMRFHMPTCHGKEYDG